MINVKQLRNKLEGNIEALSEETLNKIIKDCKEEPEPEYVPKHWDFGTDNVGRPCMAIENIVGKKMIDVGVDSIHLDNNFGEGVKIDHVHTKMGNFGDWLKQFTTDCKKTKVRCVTVFADSNSNISIGGYDFSPNKAIKFARAIMQVAFTAKRQK